MTSILINLGVQLVLIIKMAMLWAASMLSLVLRSQN